MPVPEPIAVPQMISDLWVLSKISPDSLGRLRATLESYTGFLSTEGLIKIVSTHLPEQDHGAAVFNTLKNIQSPEFDEILERVQSWRQENEQHSNFFSADAYASLEQKLPILLADYPALKLTQKVENLRVALGNELRGFAFICDARPVYNEARDDIVGMIPITMAKFVYERQNLDDAEIEFQLTVPQLKELIRKARRALDKVEVLRRKTAEWLPGGFIADEE